MTTRADLQAALGDRNLQAFLRVIREGETGQTDRAYATLVGGGQFTGWADHPRQSAWIERLQVSSTAAGAYQFLARTWDAVAQRYGLQDFSPASQDLGAVALIVGRGALDDVIAGRFEAAVRKCAPEWASLPGDVYGQGGISMSRALAVYQQWGGALAGHTAAAAPGPAAPIVESTPVTIAKEEPMAPIIAAVLPALVQAIPELTRIFGSGSEVAQRNAQAAERVVEIVTTATGAVNAQQAAERVAADPAQRQAAADAVRAEYYDLLELADVDERSRAEARSFAERMMAGGPEWRQIGYGAVIGALALTVVIGGGVMFWVLMLSPEVSGDQKGMILGALLAAFSTVLAYFFGSSLGSKNSGDAVRRLAERH